jgi:hypothetical protein
VAVSVCVCKGSGDKTVNFNMRMGLETKDYSAAAKKDNLKPLEGEWALCFCLAATASSLSADPSLVLFVVELRRLEDTVTMIHNEMQYMKQREEAMRSTNGNTHTYDTTHTLTPTHLWHRAD